ncbi:hypothetical protein K438DRAFT_294740 [Mycena galopus ATCC 62051]|nr:hypothetical protein K438DRAFT_294740 [Mycena galopus ATCC 62051]
MSFHQLGIPASNATVSLKAFTVALDMRAVSGPANILMQPVLAGFEAFHAPVFVFLVEHVATGKRVVFDLGRART